jgi:hypothetical protein
VGRTDPRCVRRQAHWASRPGPTDTARRRQVTRLPGGGQGDLRRVGEGAESCRMDGEPHSARRRITITIDKYRPNLTACQGASSRKLTRFQADTRACSARPGACRARATARPSAPVRPGRRPNFFWGWEDRRGQHREPDRRHPTGRRPSAVLDAPGGVGGRVSPSSCRSPCRLACSRATSSGA